MSIGDNIAKYRNEKKLTQVDLADKVGVSRGMIAQLERGTKSLTVQLGKQIAAVLEIPLDMLIDEG